MPTLKKDQWQLEGADFVPVELELSAAIRHRTACLTLARTNCDAGREHNPSATRWAGHARTRNAVGHISDYMVVRIATAPDCKNFQKVPLACFSANTSECNITGVDVGPYDCLHSGAQFFFLVFFQTWPLIHLFFVSLLLFLRAPDR